MKNYRTVYDLDVHAFDRPEYHWNFYDAYNNSTEVKLAAANNEISIYPSKNIDKYLSLSKQIHKSENERIYKDIHGSLPDILENLLQIQTNLGNWDNFSKVKEVLQLPESFEFDIHLSDWEKATGLALTVIRQHSELFHLLCDSHDRAMPFIKDNRIISKARDALTNFYTYNIIKIDDPVINIQTLITNEKNDLLSNDNENDCYIINPDIPDNFESISKDWIPLTSEDPLNENEIPLNFDIKQGNRITKRLTKLAINNHINKLNQPKAITPDINYYDLPDRLPKNTLPNTTRVPMKWISQPVYDKTIKDNEKKLKVPLEKVNQEIKISEEKIEAIQMKIITLYGDIENLSIEIFKCNDRSIYAYNHCITKAERNFQFDELIARLGDGYISDPTNDIIWKRNGVPGIRPKFIQFYELIQEMAEERLVRDEWKIINDLDDVKILREQQIDRKANRDRWRFIWNNEDIVYRTIHILDRLRVCKELSIWFGRNYSLLANPLMLCFNNMVAYNTLNMKEKVDEQIYTMPHSRLGIGRDITNPLFKYYLNTWRDKFNNLCIANKSFQIPNPPNITDDYDNLRIYTSLLVIFVSMGDDMIKTYEYEQKFISLSETIRGSYLLIDKSNKKKLKKTLDLAYLNSLNQPTIEDDTKFIVDNTIKIKNKNKLKEFQMKLKELIKNKEDAKKLQLENKKESIKLLPLIRKKNKLINNKVDSNKEINTIGLSINVTDIDDDSNNNNETISPSNLSRSSYRLIPQIISLTSNSNINDTNDIITKSPIKKKLSMISQSNDGINKSSNKKKSMILSPTPTSPIEYTQKVGFINSIENIKKQEILIKIQEDKNNKFNNLLKNTQSKNYQIKNNIILKPIEKANIVSSEKLKIKHIKGEKKKLLIDNDEDIERHIVTRESFSLLTNSNKITRRVQSGKSSPIKPNNLLN